MQAGGARQARQRGAVAPQLVGRLVDDRATAGGSVEPKLGDYLVEVVEAQVGAVTEGVATDAVEVRPP